MNLTKAELSVYLFTLQGSSLETQRVSPCSAMLTRRISKASRKFSGTLQDTKSSETIEDIVKNTSTNNDEDLMKTNATHLVTTNTEERLSNLVPVIADLMSFVSSKVNYRNVEIQIVTN